MTTANLKVRVIRKPVIKLKVLPKFPANVTAESPILLNRTGGNYDFALDVNALENSLAGVFMPVGGSITATQMPALTGDVTTTAGMVATTIAAIWVPHQFDTRAAAIAATIPATVNAVRLAGYSAAGDGGAALYKRVGSQPSHDGKFQSADGAWWESAERAPNAHQFGVFPTQTDTINSNGFASALAYADFLGGVPVTINVPGSYLISQAIDNFYSQVLLRGPEGTTARFHDAGTPRYPIRIVPTFAGTALKHRTPYNGAAQAVNTGGGFAYMTIDGNAIATRLLEVDTVRAGLYELYLINCVGTEAALFTSGVSGTDVGEAADIQDAQILLYIRQLDSAAARLCRGAVFTGSVNANFSFNRDVIINAQCHSAVAVDIVSADNNDFYVKALMSGGARGLYCRGTTVANPVACDSNRFRRLSTNGGIYAEGTGDPGVTGGICNSIESLDKGNGTPDPIAGTGSRWMWMASDTNTQVGIRTAGITFPATQVVSSDPNTLDDYEEGTFTPSLTFATAGNLGATYSTQSGRYTKIGRLVTGTISLTTSSFNYTTSSSFLEIAGLPFVCGVPFVAAGPVTMSGYTKAAATSLILETSNGASNFFVIGGGSGVTYTELVTTDVPTGTAKNIVAAFQYEA